MYASGRPRELRSVDLIMSLSVDDHLLIAKKVWCPLLPVIEFEDGPREVFNEVILKTLKEHNAHMEYFMLPEY